MNPVKIPVILIAFMIPVLFSTAVFAKTDVKEGKIEWFLDDINRLNNSQDFHPEIASVWPGEKIPNSGYLLPGSILTLNYKSQEYRFLNMIAWSPDGQVIPLFTNKFIPQSVTRNPVMRYKMKLPPVQGRGAVALIASKNRLDRALIEHVAKNPDSDTFPAEIESVTFTHFMLYDYVHNQSEGGHHSHFDGYNQPDSHRRYSRNNQGYHSQSRNQGYGYNAPMYYYGSPYPGQNQNYGPQGIQSVPITDLGPTYYFYPNGYVSQNYMPYPYYYKRPMYYGYPGKMYYTPQDGKNYYIIPSDNGVRTNLQDFIFNANFKYGSFVFGEDGFLGGQFYFDGSNPKRGLTMTFPAKNIWEHEGPDGSWTREVPPDFKFDFYLNGQLVPVFGGANSPFYSIPMQGFLMNGLNEFRLLPRSNPNYYGIGPIEFKWDINF